MSNEVEWDSRNFQMGQNGRGTVYEPLVRAEDGDQYLRGRKELEQANSGFSSTFAEFRKREQEVVKSLNDLQAQAQGIMETISNPEVVSALRQDKQHNLNYLKENHGVNFSFLPPFVFSRTYLASNVIRSLSIKSPTFTNSDNSNTPSDTTQELPITSTISEFSLPIPPSSCLPCGVNSPPTSSKVPGIPPWRNSPVFVNSSINAVRTDLEDPSSHFNNVLGGYIGHSSSTSTTRMVVKLYSNLG